MLTVGQSNSNVSIWETVKEGNLSATANLCVPYKDKESLTYGFNIGLRICMGPGRVVHYCIYMNF